jgi:hypothetical protein
VNAGLQGNRGGGKIKNTSDEWREAPTWMEETMPRGHRFRVHLGNHTVGDAMDGRDAAAKEEVAAGRTPLMLLLLYSLAGSSSLVVSLSLILVQASQHNLPFDPFPKVPKINPPRSCSLFLRDVELTQYFPIQTVVCY